MSYRVAVVLGCFVGLLISSPLLFLLPPSSTERADKPNKVFVDSIVEKVVAIESKCLVSKSTTISKDVNGNKAQTTVKVYRKSSGTGYILRSYKRISYIVTAAHIVGHIEANKCLYTNIYTNFVVGVGGKHTYRFKVVKVDSNSDFALLSVNVDLKQNSTLSTSLYTGKPVVSVGFPMLLVKKDPRGGADLIHGVSVSFGNVATVIKNREGQTILIRSTAPVYKGSSGGPLFDLKGNILGVCSFIIGPATKPLVYIPGFAFYYSSFYLKTFLFDIKMGFLLKK